MHRIGVAARGLYQVVRRWQKYAHLPGYPADRGNQSALIALFDLERALNLNPKRLAWGQEGRGAFRSGIGGPASPTASPGYAASSTS